MTVELECPICKQPMHNISYIHDICKRCRVALTGNTWIYKSQVVGQFTKPGAFVAQIAAGFRTFLRRLITSGYFDQEDPVSINAEINIEGLPIDESTRDET